MTISVAALLRAVGLPAPERVHWLQHQAVELVPSLRSRPESWPECVRIVVADTLREHRETVSSGGAIGESPQLRLIASDTDVVRLECADDDSLTYFVPRSYHPVVASQAFAIIAEDSAAEARRLLDDVRRLSRVASAGDASGIVNDLSELIQGWVVVVDRGGRAVAAAGAGRVHVQDAIAAAMRKPVKIRDANIQLHPLGSGVAVAGFLVVSGRARSMSRVRALAEHAAALVNLTLHVHDHTSSETHLRHLLIDTVASSGGLSSTQILQRLGVRGEEIVAFSCSTRTRQIDLASVVSRWLTDLGAPPLYRESRDVVAGWLSHELLDGFLAQIRAVNAAMGTTSIHAGLSAPHPMSASAIAWHEAQLAHVIAQSESRGIRTYSELPSERILKSAIPEELRTRFPGVLHPLAGLNHAERLTRSLFHFLNANGNTVVAAESAGIHRHTMRAHVHEIEATCNLSLQSMSDRALAWIALLADPATEVWA